MAANALLLKLLMLLLIMLLSAYSLPTTTSDDDTQVKNGEEEKTSQLGSIISNSTVDNKSSNNNNINNIRETAQSEEVSRELAKRAVYGYPSQDPGFQSYLNAFALNFMAQAYGLNPGNMMTPGYAGAYFFPPYGHYPMYPPQGPVVMPPYSTPSLEAIKRTLIPQVPPVPALPPHVNYLNTPTHLVANSIHNVRGLVPSLLPRARKMELNPIPTKTDDDLRSSLRARSELFRQPKPEDLFRTSLRATGDVYRLSQYPDSVSYATSRLVSEHEPEKKSYVEGLLHTPLRELARKHDNKAVNQLSISNSDGSSADDLETLIRELGEFNNSISRGRKPREKTNVDNNNNDNNNNRNNNNNYNNNNNNNNRLNNMNNLNNKVSIKSTIKSSNSTVSNTASKNTKVASITTKVDNSSLPVVTKTITENDKIHVVHNQAGPKDKQGEMMGTKEDPDEVNEASLTKTEDGTSVFRYLIKTKPKESSATIKKSAIGRRLPGNRPRSPVETLIDALKRKVRFEKDLIKTFVNYVCDKECLN